MSNSMGRWRATPPHGLPAIRCVSGSHAVRGRHAFPSGSGGNQFPSAHAIRNAVHDLEPDQWCEVYDESDRGFGDRQAWGDGCLASQPNRVKVTENGQWRAEWRPAGVGIESTSPSTKTACLTRYSWTSPTSNPRHEEQRIRLLLLRQFNSETNPGADGETVAPLELPRVERQRGLAVASRHGSGPDPRWSSPSRASRVARALVYTIDVGGTSDGQASIWTAFRLGNG